MTSRKREEEENNCGKMEKENVCKNGPWSLDGPRAMLAMQMLMLQIDKTLTYDDHHLCSAPSRQ